MLKVLRIGVVAVMLAGLVLLTADYAGFAQRNDPIEPQGGQVTINQIDTTDYPNLVCYATVNDSAGKPVFGLKPNDFEVSEDGVVQFSSDIKPVAVPVSVVVIVDSSGSMTNVMDQTKAAAVEFVDKLKGKDKCMVIDFDSKVKPLTGFATDKLAAREAIRKITAGGETALYDAAYEALVSAEKQSGRKAIVLLTDGKDQDTNGNPLSLHSISDVVNLANTDNIPIYIIGLGTKIEESILTQIANESGGKLFLAPEAEQLKQIYSEIARQLQSQYEIAYTTSNPSKEPWHKVTVKLTTGGVGTKAYKVPFVPPTAEVTKQYWLISTGELSFVGGTTIAIGEGLTGYTVKVKVNGTDIATIDKGGIVINVTKYIRPGTNKVRFIAKKTEEGKKGDFLRISIGPGTKEYSTVKLDSTPVNYLRSQNDAKDYDEEVIFQSE